MNITRSYYKRALGIVLMYSCDDRQSFNNIEKWMTQINDDCPESVCKVLVCNKCDMPAEEICVDRTEGSQLAAKYGIRFFETSAKTGENVQECFEALSRDIKETHFSRGSLLPFPTSKSEEIKLEKHERRKTIDMSVKKCCN
eukprot:TRINITY_DN7536_c0_g1_i2.p2 TRINITY_DN7536_c0_g1~~TRINITY_DN7536_c0_g1_i2.p2  ORF type:complete len:142 (-),score=12.51 TRINITY_DN7536_c0_g1_i2:117-542(-)